MKDVLEWMIDGLSIRSDGGCVSNLARGDLAIGRGRQALSKGIGRRLVVGRGCPVGRWGAMIGRRGTIVRIHTVRHLRWW